MNRLVKTVAATALFLTATAALAVPQNLITHNKTDDVSKAYVAGIIPPTHPANPGDNSISWFEVKMACFGHTDAGKCPALVRMEPRSGGVVDIGWVSIDLISGEISPQQINANGYTLTVNGPAEATITKN